MSIRTSKIKKLVAIPAIFLLLTLTACGSAAGATATPTLSVDAIFTAAFQTLSAQQATQAALTPPTALPSATLFPTLPPAPTQSGGLPFGTSTSSTGGTAGCNNSAFVNDVTIPDGTIINPGKSFVKTWLLQNSGTCAWSTSYKFTFISGDAMNGTSVAVPNTVPAGQQAQISVNLTAPTSSGNFKGYWRMQDDQGRYFGDSPWVAITVSGSTTTTGTASGATNTTAPSTDTPAAPTNTSTPTFTVTPP
jgi:hypothetical protein